ncbi:hypothetical protein [Streptomyces sp. UNOC14_S4]|uniref:hypothetical protein n=1 Tax=Streptomyces sp. UNOC14_S4 TaxID=2872340 RepID=UPI001E46D8E1|nr:hypothetical protein [Streptomyces sp. UNOC14_S4]MCC3770761.1 hypothetical protein [Streptomyces sp. UNOC14_S4]
MSVLAVIHIRVRAHRERRTATRRPGVLRPGVLRDAVATFARRIADSPLDSTVLRVAPAPAPVFRPVPDDRPARPHARWRMVTGPDGRRHLEAAWHLAR